MKRIQLIDTLTYPFRWLLGHLMLLVCPEFLEAVVDESQMIARRTVELTLEDTGLEVTGQEFVQALQKRMNELQTGRPEEHRLLLAYALVNGFEAREGLWENEFYAALDRRRA